MSWSLQVRVKPDQVIRLTNMGSHSIQTFIILLLMWGSSLAQAEYVRQFKIKEGVGVGTRVGFIGEARPGSSPPPRPNCPQA